MSRRLVPLLTLAAAGLVAGPASAQPLGQTPTTPTTSPAPAKGKLWLTSRSGLPTRRFRYVARGQRVKVVGFVRPYVAGQTVVVVSRRGKSARTKTATIRKASKGRGRFVVRFPTPRRGKYHITAHHRATPQQVAMSGKLKTVKAIVERAGQGSRGLKVLLLQRGLRSLGFLTPVNGVFDGGTSRAVLAFRKANSMGRDGFAGTATFRKVLGGKGRFRLRHPKAGRHVEFDWSRQVLVLAEKGKARYTIHASSGTAATPTVFGRFRFYSKTPGTNAKGMVHSNYFIGGYAIHGYPSVPNYPASHGCIRIPIPNAAFVFGQISLGETIFVYR